jgi:hypothetical protein
MVGHDHSDLRAEARMEHGSSRVALARSLIALAAVAAAVGSFFASLAIANQAALASGAAGPSTSWLLSSRDWLPWICIGFGLARLAEQIPSGRVRLRGSLIGLLFVLAASQVLAAGAAEWLRLGVASLLGVVLGMHADAARRAGWSGVVASGLVAAAAAFGVLLLPREWGFGPSVEAGGLALAMLCSLIAAALEVPAAAANPPGDRRAFWAVAGWIVVTVATVVVAVDSTAQDWISLSALVAVVCTAALARRLGLAFGAAVTTLLLTSGLVPGATSLGGADAGGDRVGLASGQLLRQLGDASVLYFRQDQELQLRLGGETVLAAGPDRGEEALLAAVLHAAVYDGDRVLWLGSGSGRVADSLRRADRCQIEGAVLWPELHALQATFAVDGPVLEPLEGGLAAASPWSRTLRELPDASRQVLVLAEWPSEEASYRATKTFQRQLRRVAGDGLVCQPIALDRISGSLLTAWFEAARDTHRWNGLYAVGNAAVLVSAAERPVWRDDFAAWCDEARWAMHAAHLGGPSDLDVAFLGALKAGPGRAPDGEPVRDIARLLMRWLTIPAVSPRDLKQRAVSQSEPALLRGWQRHQADVRRAKGRLLALANTAEGRREAQAIAAPFLPMGAPAAWLQAALGLAGPDGVALRDPSSASRCAFGMDPTFFDAPAPVFATLPLPHQERGDLEDLWRLPSGERLVERCSGPEPQAVALRQRFQSRCARSLLESLRKATLSLAEGSALRELADPFVLYEAARVLVPRGRWRELLTFWRGDVPCPRALLEIAESGGLEDRLVLAAALRGRRDPSCYPMIAEFLCAQELELRKVAGEALRMAVGARIPFEAHWPRSRRLDAASELRVLHNRKP